MKIRLQGTAGEIEQAAAMLRETFRIVSYSKPYKDRGPGETYRVYIEIKLDPAAVN